MAALLDLSDVALALIPADDGPALDVIRRQIVQCGSAHVAFLERRKRSSSQAHVLYDQPPRDPSIFTAPVIFLRYALGRYVFGRSLDGDGDGNVIILPFDHVSSEQFEISLDAQDSKATIRFRDGKTLLDGKEFPKGATADLEGGEIIEIEDVLFRVVTIRTSTTEPNPGSQREQQQLSGLKGEPIVDIGTMYGPQKESLVNALPSEIPQQDNRSIAERPSKRTKVAHAETMAFLERMSRQPVYSPVKPTMLKPQMRSSVLTDSGSSTVLEGLPKLEDYRRGAFVGKGSYGQVFKHESRHSSEVFAVKVVAFPEPTPPAGRGDATEKMAESYERKMAYINREADVLLTVNHQCVLRAHQVFRYPEGLAIVMPYFEGGDLGSLAEYPPSGKTWPLPLSDARSISGQIISGIGYIHGSGYMHRDLNPSNILLGNLDPLEVVISDFGFAQQSSEAKTRGGSRIWSAPECLWGDGETKYEDSVDVYSIGVILLWLLNVYAEDGEYTNERVYDELFGDEIRKALNSSESPEKTDALDIGQRMAAFVPGKRPSIQKCREAPFYRYWKLAPVQDTLDPSTPLESKDVGRQGHKREDFGDPGLAGSMLKAKSHHAAKVRSTSVLANSSRGPASLGVQQPARVQKKRGKVPH